ncbi:MAG: hypothetical protein ACRDY2_08215 [Acidimicrobiales bacterium]
MQTLQDLLLAPLVFLVIGALAVLIWWSAAQGEATLASQMATQDATTGQSLGSAQAIVGPSYAIALSSDAGGQTASVTGPSLGVGALAIHVGASAWSPTQSPAVP